VGTILREEGVAGFYKGMWPSIWLVAHGAIQFTAYEEIKRRIVGLGRAESASQLDTLDASVAGVASKFIATTITYPSQVLRSRLQQNTMGSREGMYQGTRNALQQTLRNEGVMALYKGFLPSIIRVLPSSAITFAVYEKTLQALRDR
jgi:solute carrier family 25 folate transporter 32